MESFTGLGNLGAIALALAMFFSAVAKGIDFYRKRMELKARGPLIRAHDDQVKKMGEQLERLADVVDRLFDRLERSLAAHDQRLIAQDVKLSAVAGDLRQLIGRGEGSGG